MDRPPNPRAPRLGPRAFSISVVNSLERGFCLPPLTEEADVALWPSANGCYADEATAFVHL